MTYLPHDLQRLEPAPTLKRESVSLVATLVLLAVAGGLAVFIGGPPVLAAMITIPIGLGFVARWCYRLAAGDRSQDDRPR
jgi:hypothetical protein